VCSICSALLARAITSLQLTLVLLLPSQCVARLQVVHLRLLLTMLLAGRECFRGTKWGHHTINHTASCGACAPPSPLPQVCGWDSGSCLYFVCLIGQAWGLPLWASYRRGGISPHDLGLVPHAVVASRSIAASAAVSQWGRCCMHANCRTPLACHRLGHQPWPYVGLSIPNSSRDSKGRGISAAHFAKCCGVDRHHSAPNTKIPIAHEREQA
jgi:hypothetical protein